MPQRAVASGEVALTGRRVIVGRFERVGADITQVADRRRQHAAFAAADVQGANDELRADVVLDELDHDFVADA